MAKLIEFDHGEDTFSEWAEDEADVVESARSYLDERGVTTSTAELREQVRTVPSPRRIKSSPEAVMRDVRLAGSFLEEGRGRIARSCWRRCGAVRLHHASSVWRVDWSSVWRAW